MTITGWLQIALVLSAVVAAAWPLGLYMARVFSAEKTILSPVLLPVERAIYLAANIEPKKEQTWLSYALAMLAINGLGFLLLYGLMRFQHLLPLNPQGFAAVPPDLAFNTAISFVTNTNWQSYGGETTMSHLVQMTGLAVQNFLSAATGIALALAVTRAFARSSVATLGNFWADLTRATLYVLLPLSILVALGFALSGVPQTLAGNSEASTVEGAKQVIALGPVASQEAIKQLGTNGGGFFNVNASHPFENPNAWSNLLSIWAMLLISTALPITFGRLVGDMRQGVALLAVMYALLVTGVAIVYAAETSGVPSQIAAGIDPAMGNMEGKEVRFGQALTALYVVATTGLSCGAVNAMHNSLTPIGGLVPLFMIQLGEILPGGVGSGLYGIIVMAILAVFVAGLMVGRTPEYLGKKIEAFEMKMASLVILIPPMFVLVGTAIAVAGPGLEYTVGEEVKGNLNNPGAHGFSEVLYAFSSAGNNNGSAFAGLTANEPFYNTLLGVAMFASRYWLIIPTLAIAGSLARKKYSPPGPGTLPTHQPLFVVTLVSTVLLVGALTFVPALALGPVVEHLQMIAP
jgi:K+-transporting ATPase ATPase A chain